MRNHFIRTLQLWKRTLFSVNGQLNADTSHTNNLFCWKKYKKMEEIFINFLWNKSVSALWFQNEIVEVFTYFLYRNDKSNKKNCIRCRCDSHKMQSLTFRIWSKVVCAIILRQTITAEADKRQCTMLLMCIQATEIVQEWSILQREIAALCRRY